MHLTEILGPKSTTTLNKRLPKENNPWYYTERAIDIALGYRYPCMSKELCREKMLEFDIASLYNMKLGSHAISRRNISEMETAAQEQ